VEPYLGRIAPFRDHAFAALNTALFEDGAYVAIPKDTAVEAPLEIVHVATGGAAPAALQARTLIVAEEGSEAQIVETFVSLGEGAYFRNAVCEIVLRARAKIDHHRVQAESPAAWHVGVLQADQARDSRLVSHNVSFGALLARLDLGSKLDGAGADCQLYGLAFADGARLVDNHTVLDHAHPNCPSWEVYKTILAGAARGVFSGRIIVRPDAQKTDAKQSNKNLLLSPEALVFTRPQLEIYANDVKCTHGATIGRLDEEAAFYLRARGIGKDEARDLLIRAFALDVLDKIRSVTIRERVEAELARRLPRTVAD
jgi:Fe-S cluster assembly protein SufD